MGLIMFTVWLACALFWAGLAFGVFCFTAAFIMECITDSYKALDGYYRCFEAIVVSLACRFIKRRTLARKISEASLYE